MLRSEPLRQVATPEAFPAAGSYDVQQLITLTCTTPDARIHYTLDDRDPTPDSPVFDPYRLIPAVVGSEGDGRSERTTTIRAMAVARGMLESEVASFEYRICPRPKTAYITRRIESGVVQISDWDNDRMYVVSGTERALLIDAGFGTGDLVGLVERLVQGLPLDVVITHGHPDHVAQMGQFQDRCAIYMHAADLPMAKLFQERMGFQYDLERIKTVREGQIFDLGGRKLRVYEVPGHSAGSIVLLDEVSGLCFAGDAVGSNRPTITDAVWLQFPSAPAVDVILSAWQVFRSKVAGKLTAIYTGHNGDALGEAYLDSLLEAAQQLVDRGVEVLVPSWRPVGVWQTVWGDRLTDPNWAAINVDRERCLSAPPEQIATLSNLEILGGVLEIGRAHV